MSIVLSTLEFDVLWECERLPGRHVAIDVPSPGRTYAERDELVADALAGLAERGLASGKRVTPELADWLNLLASPQVSVDGWVWTDHEIKALAAASGGEALLAVVDRAQVWLIPTRETALAEAAVSFTGEMPAGPGRSVSLPTDVLREADSVAAGDPAKLSVELSRLGVSDVDANLLAGMVGGMTTRGQFGAERVRRNQRVRADRVVAFHDTSGGRYVYLAKANPDGRSWSTVTPADNTLLARSVWELLDEL